LIASIKRFGNAVIGQDAQRGEDAIVESDEAIRYLEFLCKELQASITRLSQVRPQILCAVKESHTRMQLITFVAQILTRAGFKVRVATTRSIVEGL
jgi:hypothetical protein